MTYLDTSLLIAYVDEKDSNHIKAEKILSKISKRMVSSLVKVELAATYSRAGLSHPVDHALYSIKKTGAETADIDFNKVLKEALKLAPIINLRTPDLLHITACYVLKEDSFATFDEEISRKADIIKRELGLRIVNEP